MKRIIKYLCIAVTAAMSLFPTIANGQDAIYKIGVPATKGCSNMEEVDWTGMCTNSGVFDVPMIYSRQSIAFRTYLPNIEQKTVETICGEEQ